MKDQKLEKVLRSIAKEHHTTPEKVRQEMQLAMEMGMASTDPMVRARWAMIPKKGETLTLEEFVAYLAAELEKRKK